MTYKIKRFSLVGKMDRMETDFKNAKNDIIAEGNEKVWDAMGIGNTWVGKALKKQNRMRHRIKNGMNEMGYNFRSNFHGGDN